MVKLKGIFNQQKLAYRNVQHESYVYMHCLTYLLLSVEIMQKKNQAEKKKSFFIAVLLESKKKNQVEDENLWRILNCICNLCLNNCSFFFDMHIHYVSHSFALLYSVFCRIIISILSYFHKSVHKKNYHSYIHI